MAEKSSSSSYTVPFLAILGLAAIALVVALTKSGPVYPEHWINSWKMCQSFSTPRRALAAVASQSHLYAIGGVDDNGNYVKTVEFARIEKNGDLGSWQQTSSLNQGRFYLAAVVVGQFIYALGGGSGPIGEDNQPIASVERATINPDGSLSSWSIVSYMQLPRRGLKAVVVNNRIYAIGGYSGVFLKSTEHTFVDSYGNLSTWDTDPQEARVDRYIHSATTSNNRIYLLGGHVQRSDQMSYGDVESADIKVNGYLDPWEIEKSKLLQPRFIASAFSLADRIYILGGHNGGNRLNSVEFARIFRNGRVGDWQQTTPLNVPRSAATAATYGDFVYVLGGMGNSNALNSVEMATYAKNGQLGNLDQ